MKQITLNIGGQDRVFYFGLGFLGNLLETENIEFHEIDEKIKSNPFKWMSLIMYHSLAYGYIRENKDVVFSKFDVSDWIDDCEEYETIEVEIFNQETFITDKIKQQIKAPVNKFFTAFRQSLVKNVPVDTSKKKVTKK